MAEQKDQKIIVLIELNENDLTLIQHGIRIALFFKKELCLVYNARSKKSGKEPFSSEKISRYIQMVKDELPRTGVSSLILQVGKAALADVLAEHYEGIIIVANARLFKKYSNALTESPVPWLFVHPNSEIMAYNRLIQSVDLRKEISDSSLWCSYFGRFNKAEIVVVAANDSSKEGKLNVAKNVKLSSILYKKFNIVHKMYKGSKSSFRTAFEAMELALASDCNLFVMLGSSSITPLDYLIGLPERKIVRQAGKLPVLVINPRRDNYVLCD
jgi:hypothetical protein